MILNLVYEIFQHLKGKRRYKRPVKCETENINENLLENITASLEKKTNIYSKTQFQMEPSTIIFANVAGYEQIKQTLIQSAILTLNGSTDALENGVKSVHSILLYGPSGCGKTLLGTALTMEVGRVKELQQNNVSLFTASSADLISKYIGESSLLVQKLFQQARTNAPAIIFLDEISWLCSGNRGKESDGIKQINREIANQIEQIKVQNEHILVLATTAFPWELEPTTWKLFDNKIGLQLPSLENRVLILRKCLENSDSEMEEKDFQYLAEHTEGFSGADILIIVREALYLPMRVMLNATHFKKISSSDQTFTYFTPCKSDDPEAIEIGLLDLPQEQILERKVTMADFEEALKNIKPSSCDLEKWKIFEEQAQNDILC